jgi:hypothetical protein
LEDGYVCWLPIAIRIEEKGEGFENGNCSLASWFTFNPNHFLQSLTEHWLFENSYKGYEGRIKIENIDLAYY